MGDPGYIPYNLYIPYHIVPVHFRKIFPIDLHRFPIDLHRFPIYVLIIVYNIILCTSDYIYPIFFSDIPGYFCPWTSETLVLARPRDWRLCSLSVARQGVADWVAD